jgi:beta-glucosidase
LQDKGVKVMLTLHHFANPNWFSERGGWANQQSPEVFENYASNMAHAFGDSVDYWNTFNEPGTYALHSHILGFFPPHKHNLFTARRVFRNQVEAHKKVYPVLNETNKPVGVSNITMVFEPVNPLGILPAAIADRLVFQIVPDAFQPTDFSGISYYGRIPFTPFPVTELNNPGKLARMGRTHDNMWEYYPAGLCENVCRFAERYGKPVIITEHGCCTDDDSQRAQGISDHLSEVHRARTLSKTPVLGYFHWTTFDCPEHHLGWKYPFGLVKVDRKNGERTIKSSGNHYRQISRDGFLEV